MDLVADKLQAEIDAGCAANVRAENLRPPYRRRIARLPLLGASSTAQNADRFLNRMIDYPRHARQCAARFDCFHVCDHAYANLVHALPAERCGVFCHDLDTFRCLFDPAAEPRPLWFKKMMRRVLDGFKQAALIFHTTHELRRQILARGLVPESRLIQVPLGVSGVFNSNATPAFQFSSVALRDAVEAPFLLHVGSCIPRKRIDVLLDIAAGLKLKHNALRLIKIGGTWSAPQRAQLEHLNLARDCVHIPWLDEKNLAQLYRRAAVVLQPSDAEGFGLPVIEALACGAIVVASDIPTLREAGGEAAVYCPVGAVGQWVETIDRLLRHPESAPATEKRLEQASKSSWTAHAEAICAAYRKIAH